ncbi:DUF3343 domain-containing protein [Vagococcus sp. BWB3-3]|uniref:DUF3343 domain-containing protein n=1 Tax=Vagococcus allomyrinae TaxID=2794353 RepID=A0A940PAK7_9ENTE|nr:DUF3343 domain-containing protein [Vagococcus allomyrinae]MBP1040503.1 DUF3343 domain-containing protein [Vagococcus allomyrinae]
MDYLVAFNSTHQAMEVELWIKEAQLNARLIPTPESIAASCGLALKFNESSLASIVQHLRKNNQQVDMYQIVIDQQKLKTYVRCQMEGVLNE